MTTALLAAHPHPTRGAHRPHTQQPAGTTHATAAHQRPRAQVMARIMAGTTRWTVRLILLLAITVFAGLAVGPHLLGYRTMTMLTGSMSPLIDPGDVTIVTPLPVSQIHTGMILSYHIPIDDHRLISHRVTTVDHNPDGTTTVQTKGDANPSPDPWQATLRGDTAWQVRAVIPHLGTAIEALRTPPINQALLYGTPTLLTGWLLLTIWRPTRTPTKEDQP